MTPDGILSVLKEATNKFGEISVKPTDDDLSRIGKNLLQILIKIPYDQAEDTHNLSALIAPYAKYTTKYGTGFKLPTRPKPYCPTITATMSDAD